MVSTKDLRELVAEYVKASIELPDFAARFAGVFYDIEKSGDAAAVQFSYRIEVQLAKQSEGIISTQVLRNSLASLIEAQSSQQQVEFATIEQHPDPLSPSSNSGNGSIGGHASTQIQALPHLVSAL